MVSFAARMANMTEAGIIRRLISDSALPEGDSTQPDSEGVDIHADYEGHRVRARYFAPTRIEITDGPLAGRSFKSPTGAARAVIRHYNPSVNDNRNGWTFWQLAGESGDRVTLQSIRPRAIRAGRGSLKGRLVTSDDWDSPEVNDDIARDFGLTP
ncbi:hypothetical protein AB0C07_05470 [Actinoplanes missouriensis]|uniref:hypothetical protein n=1 Tax=Actinoplanes missouriensis TaxID=1866 RepID=UPI003401DA86